MPTADYRCDNCGLIAEISLPMCDQDRKQYCTCSGEFKKLDKVEHITNGVREDSRDKE